MLYKKNICVFYVISVMICVFGCKRNMAMRMDEWSHSSTESSSSFDLSFGDLLNPDAFETSSSDSQTEPKGAILLLHGLMADADELSSIAQFFRRKFRDSVLIIEPECRVGNTSFCQSIENQAKYVFQAIEQSLKFHNKQAADFPLIIIGYSQGGIVGLTLANNYADKLNIHGIVAMNSPIMGAQVLNCRPRDIKRFMSQGQEGLQIIHEDILNKYKQSQMDIKPPKGIRKMKTNLWFYSFCLKFLRFNKFGGLRGICPNSKTICNVQDFLYQGHNRIPCLLIGTYQDNVGKLFDNRYRDSTAVEKLNFAFNKLITGKVYGKHDTLIPLSSQLCRGPSLDDLSIEGDRTFFFPKLPGVQCNVYKDITHAENLIAIDDNLFVMNKSIHVVTESNRVLRDLSYFVRDMLDL